MKRKIVKTADGSTTIQLIDWDEQYHSLHGAVNEAYHVFIQTGLHYYLDKNKVGTLSILEIGFGTGLNAFITALEAKKCSIEIQYTGVEAYPVQLNEALAMNYVAQIDGAAECLFSDLHTTSWEERHKISDHLTLLKRKIFFSEIASNNEFDIIYFDAFGARVQPELWTVEIFKKMFNALRSNGILVTYSAKGSVRRAMQEVGFIVERLPGPPGKREMLRATKR
ncbi:tRNA (5-methylaminomethyl-2-thiouridine)(34)-methyltransferase MnmD [Aquimarina intermedia]|uniref:tRNA U34 5-methylaminomethyl-2-thiouridine-forming methyltransferase MnmC n=1 Tax=Aquimarina intermedia TaxID=350814 RepID=A0A5S5BX53_9FLAO|nr:tRNA (5-methylaminomethyl-2-thiouridine)(34)-methyltransferase MnmD [Aquimarina intermedia]TYP70908.1 tRNA U34 5-methylaminomethyl-2-thiouridine-forming methyltransferase MnmC [Aquimarina intermedia]